MVFIAFFLFAASPGYAWGYGEAHYGYSHGYHGYTHHYGYGHHYGHHGYYGHIGATGYVALGVLSVLVLSHLLNNNNYRDRWQRRSDPWQIPKTSPIPARVVVAPTSNPVYSYSKNEGWDSLSRGNAKQALDIFAIQSQQDLNSGIPKIGFALAAAVNGEMDRGIRAMRNAIRIDPVSLNKLNITEDLELTIDVLNNQYMRALQNEVVETDKSFMVATLSYLQQDYNTANNMISESDQSQSANNLRALIKTGG